MQSSAATTTVPTSAMSPSRQVGQFEEDPVDESPGRECCCCWCHPPKCDPWLPPDWCFIIFASVFALLSLLVLAFGNEADIGAFHGINWGIDTTAGVWNAARGFRMLGNLMTIVCSVGCIAYLVLIPVRVTWFLLYVLLAGYVIFGVLVLVAACVDAFLASIPGASGWSGASSALGFLNGFATLFLGLLWYARAPRRALVEVRAK